MKLIAPAAPLVVYITEEIKGEAETIYITEYDVVALLGEDHSELMPYILFGNKVVGVNQAIIECRSNHTVKKAYYSMQYVNSKEDEMSVSSLVKCEACNKTTRRKHDKDDTPEWCRCGKEEEALLKKEKEDELQRS